MTTPDKYFKPKMFVAVENIIEFRECYRRLSKITDFDDHEIDKKTLLDAAQELGIQVDLPVHEELLVECVKCEDEDTAISNTRVLLSNPALQLPSASRPKPVSSVERPNNDKRPTNLTEIKCVILVKRRNKDVIDFLQTFLLQNVKKANTQKPNSDNTWLPGDNKIFSLQSDTILALFVHERMKSLGTIRRPKLERLRLVEPFHGIDDFSSWAYDHFRGIFEIELRPHIDKFPPCWTLANDTRIYCQFIFNDTRDENGTMTNLKLDRPRTDSLEQFVEDTCAREENGKAQQWIEALYAEDIFTYSHLSNLKQSEWDHIRQLRMNAKRILKEAVDRERESAADDRRRCYEDSSPNEVFSRSSDDNTPKEPRSELLADIHLIKLFICHTLRFERAVQKQGALPKIEKDCVNLSFDEMRAEGYADDGLFSTMSEFFLPLTISEQELRMPKSNVNKLVGQGQLEVLTKETDRLKRLLNEASMNRWDIDEKLINLMKERKQKSSTRENERSRVNPMVTAAEQAKKLRQTDREWEANQEEFQAKSDSLKSALNHWINRENDYEKQLNDCYNKINNIHYESVQPSKPVDKGLVKPARGFIMYGPPGTGKSEIMSKLSKKLGIAMVGPPLAAGELNRPLVGESERVIIALASRCHRIPYAMCCLSIDEIDSLAPKRDDDSSEGKVDKISVLLSLIDGIKDVPNLMIFCATNRLHMMDEAFLRRMSGKFFVGRPSSQARSEILTEIPKWALEANIIDELVIATTNFSGAACRAFTRAVTVHCMTKQRTESTYHIKYRKALEIADRTAKQYQIFLGSETLPRLLIRRLITGSKIIRNRLIHHTYTGRIIVDIPEGSVRVEIIENNGHAAVIEHKLSQHETNVQSLLERLTVYGKDRNVQLLQLVDLNLLASQGAFDEKKVFETLKERFDECIAYNRSMIVYDLDALVGVNKSESDSSMGRSNSASIVNQSVYTYVCSRFREAVVEQQQQQHQMDDDDDEQKQQKQQSIEKWAVAVIQDPFLFRQFAANVKFPRTRFDEEKSEIERRKAEDLLKCVKCKDFYVENENKIGNCVHHDGFIYDNSAPDLAIHVQSDVIFQLNKLESEAIKNPARHEKIDREKTKFKWICCDTTVNVGAGTGGCKKGKHGFGERAKSYVDKKAIDEWEGACRRNREYNEKWLRLLENRC